MRRANVCSNVRSICGIGKWMRSPLQAYGAPVNTASHLDVNWTRGPSADLISPCWNHSSSRKGTTNLTHGTRAVKSASYPFFMRKGGLCGLRGVTNTKDFLLVFFFCFVVFDELCYSLVKKTLNFPQSVSHSSFLSYFLSAAAQEIGFTLQKTESVAEAQFDC